MSEGLLAGARVLVTGVITHQSIAYAVARAVQRQGGRVVLTVYGRPTLVRRVAARLPEPVDLVDLDVADEESLAGLADRLRPYTDGIDGVLHSIAYAPPGCLGDGFLAAPWADVARTLQVSTHSLAALVQAVSPLLTEGASVVGLDFDPSRVWPGYGWMGVAKAGLEATCRTLAAEYGPRGVRVNLVCSGPLRTVAGAAVPGEADSEREWRRRAPLGWDPADPSPVADACVALFSPLLRATTGTVVHVDGGRHAMA